MMENSQEQNLELRQIIDGVHEALDTHPIKLNGDINMTLNGVGEAFQFLMGIVKKQAKALEDIQHVIEPIKKESDYRETRNKFIAQLKQKPVVRHIIRWQHQKWFQLVMLFLVMQIALWVSKKIDPDQDSRPAQAIKQLSNSTNLLNR